MLSYDLGTPSQASVLRPNSWTKSRQKFSFLLFTVTSLQPCLDISISSNSLNLLTVATVQLLYTVRGKGGKPDRKPYPLPYSLRNPYRNLKSENSQDYAQNPQRNCTFMNSPDVTDTLRTCSVQYSCSPPLSK